MYGPFASRPEAVEPCLPWTSQRISSMTKSLATSSSPAVAALCVPFMALSLSCATALAENSAPREREEVVVIDTRLRIEEEIETEELQRRARSTLGGTLEETMGVANASFGAGVGLPVIRGLQGSRIHVSINGTGSHDASTISPDHAIPVEPLLADKIRVWRGPAAILFGGGAIGGAVEIDDGRIPRMATGDSPVIKGELRYNSALDEYAGAGKLDRDLGPLTWHLAGFARDRDTMEIPGDAIDEAAVREQFGLVDLNNTRGHVANSEGENHGGSIGTSLIRDWGLAGVSFTRSDFNYGIPPGGHPPHSHGGGPVAAEVTEEVRIDLVQSRTDVLLELNDPLNLLKKIELRGALVDYRHDELDQGAVSTTFKNDVKELRLDLTHDTAPGLTTVAGLDYKDRDFSALGAEEFVPPVAIRTQGTYVFGQFDSGALSVDAGWRWERHETDLKQPDRMVGGIPVLLPLAMEYEAVSYSSSLAVRPWKHFSARLSAQKTQRAPEIQEMLALGPHLATRSFDMGNLALRLEKSTAFELALTTDFEAAKSSLTLFSNRIDNFIYQENQGYFYDLEEELFRVRCVRLEQCLPVLAHMQQDAEFYGAEAQVNVPIHFIPAVSGSIELFADYSRGRFQDRDAGDVPRQPAPRAGIELTLSHGAWKSRTRWTHALEQSHAGLNETTTDGYDLLNLSLERGVRIAGTDLLLSISGRNLLDEEIRNSVSFLRSFAPEVGRSVELGLSLSR